MSRITYGNYGLNGEALVRSLKPGDIVTVRWPNGRRSRGRAEMRFRDQWFCRPSLFSSFPVTPDNIVSISRRLS